MFYDSAVEGAKHPIEENPKKKKWRVGGRWGGGVEGARGFVMERATKTGREEEKLGRAHPPTRKRAVEFF